MNPSRTLSVAGLTAVPTTTTPTKIDLYLLAMTELFRSADKPATHQKPVSCAPDRDCTQRPSRSSLP
jgi:hypothetical protein